MRITHSYSTFFGLIALVFMDAGQTAWAGGVNDPFGTAKQIPKLIPTDCAKVDAARQTLNLTQAIDLALCRNPETGAAWANAKAAAARLGQSESAYLPSADFTYSAERSHINNSSRSSGSNSSNTARTRNNNLTGYGPGFSISYLLYDFGGREAAVESARQAMLDAGWTYNSQMQALVFNVIKAYADVFSGEESVDAAKEAEKSGKEAFAAAKARLDVGLVTPADTAQAETSYAQLTLAREQAENTLKRAQGSLATLLHLSPATRLTLEPLSINPSENPFKDTADALIKQALAQRPDVIAAKAREKQLEAELRRARARNYPSIGLSAGSQVIDYTQDTEPARHQSNLTLQLRVPLFSGFSNTYQTQSARYAATAATNAREQTEDEVSLDVWTSYHNFETAQQNYKTAQTLIKSAETSEALTLGRYKAGKGTLLDALDAQAKLADARRQWVAARYNLLVTRYDLARALGDTKDILLKK